MFRGTRMMCVSASLSLCLVGASATAHAQGSTGTTVADCTPPAMSSTVKCFSVTTVPASAVAINTGTDTGNMVPTVDRSRITHHIWIRGLSPGSTYYGNIALTSKGGKKRTMPLAAFSTAMPGSVPATSTQSSAKLLLNGQPWFEIAGVYTGTICPSLGYLSGLKGLGGQLVNDVIQPSATDCEGSGSNPPQLGAELHALLKGNLWLEVDTPAQYESLKQQGLTELVDWRAQPLKLFSPSPKVYENPCNSASKLFDAVTAASRTQPVVFQTSISAHPILPSRDTCTTPANLTMLFWATVAGGGKGIVYQTSDAGNGSSFDPANGLAATARQLSTRIATLGPAVMTGAPANMKWNNSGAVKFGGWKYGGYIYVIAVNSSSDPQVGAVRLPSKNNLRAQVMWEARQVVMSRGTISDKFASQSVHIYKVPLQ